MGGHGRYEELAVGHVLGGLATAEAAAFRTHLLECRDCRMRVAELRDIAADLAQAEREERRLAATKTRVARRQQPDEPEDRSRWWQSRLVVPLVGILVVALSLGLLVWNYHLRTNNRELLDTTEERERVVEALARGDLVDTELSGGVTGLVAVTDAGVAVNLAGIPDPADRQLVVWLLGEEGSVARRTATASAGRLALFAEHGDAMWLVVSLEIALGERPGGQVLARASLAASGDPAPSSGDPSTPVPAGAT